MASRLNSIAAWVAVCASFAAVASLLVHLWPAGHLRALQWLVGLAVHWQWMYLALGAPACLLWSWQRRRVLPALVCLPLLASGWLFHSPAAPVSESTAPALRIGAANLNAGNRDLSSLQAWLASPEAPDVLVLTEFTDLAARAVSSTRLRAAYPHRLLLPSRDPFGVAILSRQPFQHAQPVHPADPGHTPRLRVALQWGAHQVRVSAVHPMPPLNQQFAQLRDQALLEEAGWLTQPGALGILAGDLNDTPWSTGMRGVQHLLKRATGLAPTWPNSGGWLSILPLDHVLVTDGWQVRRATRGPDLGSDHRPVVVELTSAGEQGAQGARRPHH